MGKPQYELVPAMPSPRPEGLGCRGYCIPPDHLSSTSASGGLSGICGPGLKEGPAAAFQAEKRGSEIVSPQERQAFL